jgi:hypothetical protein
MARKPTVPEEVTKEQSEVISKALETEQAAIGRAIGDASLAWANLESALSNIFFILAFEQKDVEIAGVIFYTPSNFETRLAIVDNLMAYHFTVNQEAQS